MKLTFVFALLTASAHAFAPQQRAARPLLSLQEGRTSAELGTPCEDECALESFPNLPESVHPGVLSGQAMMDLLNHAKENGTLLLLLYYCLLCCYTENKEMKQL